MPDYDTGEPDISLLAAALAAGAGLFLGGLSNLILARTPLWARAAAVVAACVGAAAGVWAVFGEVTEAAAGGVFACVGLALAAPRQPGARWAAAGAAGLVLTIGAVALHAAAEEDALDRAQADLAAAAEKPPTHPAQVPVFTDRGTRVGVLQATRPRPRAELAAREARPTVGPPAIRSQSADDRSNCHGWVFTGGRFWVGEADVELIVAENGYRAVSDPRPGDLAVYRVDGAVTHSAVVRYVAPGMPVMVEGKWGGGAVYLHAAGESGYGSDPTYYRAARAGHLLAGVPAPDAPAGGQ